MKSIPFERFYLPGLSREAQIRRIRQAIQNELTVLQREAIVAVYFQNKTLTQFARERSVNKSTVSRTLKRAEEKLRRHLCY